MSIIEDAMNSIDIDFKIKWNGKETTIKAHHEQQKEPAVRLVEPTKQDSKKEEKE